MRNKKLNDNIISLLLEFLKAVPPQKLADGSDNETAKFINKMYSSICNFLEIRAIHPIYEDWEYECWDKNMSVQQKQLINSYEDWEDYCNQQCSILIQTAISELEKVK